MKIRQTAVLRDLSDTPHIVYARRPPRVNEWLNLVSFFQMTWKESTNLFKLHLGHCVKKQLCTYDLNNVLVSCAQAATG